MNVKTFVFGLHRFLVKKKTGLCGREDAALSAVRPPVNITFLEMALVLKRLPTPDLERAHLLHVAQLRISPCRLEFKNTYLVYFFE